MNHIYSRTFTYYWISAVFSAARMGIGATAVIYMLQNGCDLSDIALVKILQGVVIFFAEVPTGLIADTLGRKASLYLSALCAIASFALFLAGDHIGYFAVAEVFNALCISFWSGAFEAISVEGVKADKREGNFLEVFFSRNASFAALGTMLGGLIGGFLGEYDIAYPFYLSAFLMFVALLSILAMTKETHRAIFNPEKVKGVVSRLNAVTKKMVKYKKDAFYFASSSKHIRSFFIIQILIQFALQPVFHYWQPFFQSFSKEIHTGHLGMIFFAYVAAQMIVSAAVSFVLENTRLHVSTINNITAYSALAGFLVLSLSKSIELSIVAFIVMQGASNSFRNTIGATFNRYVDNSNRATVLSSVSFISRFGMLFHLVILKFTSHLWPLQYSYVLSTISFIAAIPFLITWNRD